MLPGSGKALLFDIDGTLADTDALHPGASGFSNASIGARFLAEEPPARQAAIIGEKEAAFRKLLAGKIQPVPGLMPLLALADRAGIPMVAVTNASRPNAELLLSGLGIKHRFKALVISDELGTASRIQCHIWRDCAR
jgi:FMN phosphatase YigB (HAD superfamily)